MIARAASAAGACWRKLKPTAIALAISALASLAAVGVAFLYVAGVGALWIGDGTSVLR